MRECTIACCMARPTQSRGQSFPRQEMELVTQMKNSFPHWRSFQSFTGLSGTTSEADNQSPWLSTADGCLYTANVFTPQTMFTCKSKLSRVGGTNVGCATIEASKHTDGRVGEFCGGDCLLKSPISWVCRLLCVVYVEESLCLGVYKDHHYLVMRVCSGNYTISLSITIISKSNCAINDCMLGECCYAREGTV